MAVIQASPRLASQAPNVRVVITRRIQETLSKYTIINTRLKIIASNERRIIKRCWR